MDAKRLLITCLLSLAPLTSGARADTERTSRSGQLQKRRQELQVQLLKERAALLREDPELRALHERIQKLYRQLDELLAKRETIRKLQNELKAVEGTLTKHAGTEGGE